jgi:hypothetical protein
MYFADFARVRKLRVEYEGAIYHVMNRGDRLVGEMLSKAGWSEDELKRLAKAIRRKRAWRRNCGTRRQ